MLTESGRFLVLASWRSVQQGAVYTTRDKVGSCRPSPKHGASKSRASVRRWSTTRHKSGTGVPTTAQLRITNFVEAHVFHSLQKMTQTEEACGSAQGGHTTPHPQPAAGNWLFLHWKTQTVCAFHGGIGPCLSPALTWQHSASSREGGQDRTALLHLT
ncbi:uncharacterized protein LOC123499676 [Portunus trituberculatus]|uniref:uncharacterized protein LOC123499676 n=1 Tax=Portunus trituberculatus TaxID=210409 RepID=UPI001E1D0F6C|nr:uncharacterized protein LOC123499676 [Portunus trituberculatus]